MFASKSPPIVLGYDVPQNGQGRNWPLVAAAAVLLFTDAVRLRTHTVRKCLGGGRQREREKERERERVLIWIWGGVDMMVCVCVCIMSVCMCVCVCVCVYYVCQNK